MDIVGTCDSVTEQRSVGRTVPLDTDTPQTPDVGAAVEYDDATREVDQNAFGRAFPTVSTGSEHLPR